MNTTLTALNEFISGALEEVSSTDMHAWSLGCTHRHTSVCTCLCRWGATPLQDAYLSGDQVMCALLERAGGKRADHPAIKDKLPAQLVSPTTIALLC